MHVFTRFSGRRDCHQESCGYSAHDSAVGYIADDDCARADRDVVADRYGSQNGSVCANRQIVSNSNSGWLALSASNAIASGERTSLADHRVFRND